MQHSQARIALLTAHSMAAPLALRGYCAQIVAAYPCIPDPIIILVGWLVIVLRSLVNVILAPVHLNHKNVFCDKDHGNHLGHWVIGGDPF